MSRIMRCMLRRCSRLMKDSCKLRISAQTILRKVSVKRSASTCSKLCSTRLPPDYFSSSLPSPSTSSQTNFDIQYHQVFAPILSSSLAPWFNPNRSLPRQNVSQHPCKLTPQNLDPRSIRRANRRINLVNLKRSHSHGNGSTSRSNTTLATPSTGIWDTIFLLSRFRSPYFDDSLTEDFAMHSIERIESAMDDWLKSPECPHHETLHFKDAGDFGFIEAALRLVLMSQIFCISNPALAAHCHRLVHKISDQFVMHNHLFMKLLVSIVKINSSSSREIGSDFWDTFRTCMHTPQVPTQILAPILDSIISLRTSPFSSTEHIYRFVHIISHPAAWGQARNMFWLGDRGQDHAKSLRYHRNNMFASHFVKYVSKPGEFFAKVCSGEIILDPSQPPLSEAHQSSLFRTLVYPLLPPRSAHFAFDIWKQMPTLDLSNTHLFNALYCNLRSMYRPDLTGTMLKILESKAAEERKSYALSGRPPPSIKDFTAARALSDLKFFREIDLLQDTSSYEVPLEKIDHLDYRQLLDLMSILGDNGMPEATEFVADFIKEKADATMWSHRLGVDTLGQVMRSYAMVSDINNMEETMLRIVYDEGLFPTNMCYRQVLIGFSQKLEVAPIYDTWKKMLAHKLIPDVPCYTQLMRVHCNRREPHRAKQIMENMYRDHKKKPDLVMYTVLMQGYLDVGNWDEVIRLFRQLECENDPFMRPDQFTISILLKAYIATGSPLSDIITIFHHLARVAPPSAQTYNLIIQAACNAGAMGMAEDIFRQLDRPESKVQPNVFHFTTLISGFTQRYDFDKARDYYDMMKERDIKPTTITGSVLVQMYAKMLVGEDIKDIEQMADSALKAVRNAHGRDRLFSMDKLRGSGQDVAVIFTPLIRMAVKLLDPELVKHYYGKAVEDSRTYSLLLLTYLLESCCAVGDTDTLLKLWDIVYDHAKDLTTDNDTFTWVANTTPDLAHEHKNLLCAPLSIMIDGLINANMHEEVKTIWNQVKTAGFGFDPGNWNRLAISFLKSGSVSRAFWIVEDIILGSEVSQNNSNSTWHEQALAPKTDEEIDEEKMIESLLSSDLVEPAYWNDPRLNKEPLRPSEDEKFGRIPFKMLDLNDEIDSTEKREIENDEDMPARQALNAAITPHTAKRHVEMPINFQSIFQVLMEQILKASKDIQGDLSKPLRITRYLRGVNMWSLDNESLECFDRKLKELKEIGRGPDSPYARIIAKYPKTVSEISKYNFDKDGQDSSRRRMLNWEEDAAAAKEGFGVN